MSRTRYLLDTNVLSELVRQPQGVVARQIAAVGEGSVCTSIIVAVELRFGAAKRGLPQLMQQVDAILNALEVLPLEPPADDTYAQVRCRLERTGRPIGPNDLLIAAHALALDCTLVTANMGEFGRVPGLQVVNWLAPEASA
ncbi:type II toxin-antitoxin system VapC family toxin [Comamonas flocculans]|uniref:Ribonuclease VapC n=1 Tax=Comamonas flocculans TaxID=2597701 RepID=A0A5B8RX27_9BURK|nr:type II toxin-antitoxin system VapC family toxin [Comamonas flocculans]QEA13274.1 type II toxin-antitoxin system VapC family toxin [Comamonas flocculans]